MTIVQDTEQDRNVSSIQIYMIDLMLLTIEHCTRHRERDMIVSSMLEASKYNGLDAAHCCMRWKTRQICAELSKCDKLAANHYRTLSK